MPYYRWRGVMLDSTTSGYGFAHDREMLDQQLLKRGIALVSCKVVRKRYLHGIQSEQVLFFFEHLQTLLASGVHLWQALVVISEQIGDERLADVIYQMSILIREGSSFHEALAQYPALFNQQVIHIAHIGMQAGDLAIALQALCYYLRESDQFKKKLRQVLLLPLCTVAAFMLMLLFILFVVLPRYSELFVAMGKEVPHTTRMLLQLNNYLFSYYMIGSLFIAATLVVVAIKIKHVPSVKIMIDEWMLKVPYIGLFVQKVSIVHFLQSVSLLLQGGMLLVPALKIAQQSVANRYIYARLQTMIDEVQDGSSLSEAMQHACGFIFKQDIILLVTVGEQTATLTEMMQKATYIYQKQIERALNRYLLLIQPVLMLLLGILVAGVICTVYMPLFNLADVI